MCLVSDTKHAGSFPLCVKLMVSVAMGLVMVVCMQLDQSAERRALLQPTLHIPDMQ